jgi:hypothetical protein
VLKLPQLAVFGCLLVGTLACQSKSEPSPSESRAPAGSLAAPSPATAASAAPQISPAGLPEEDARRFMARWEAAQNAGDFATYGKLYGERFMGVKRVGSYSKRFDRAAWLLDRKPMVEGRAQVKVTKLQIVSAAGATRALFTQEFVAKGFRDIGQKELFLVASPSGIVISREEMLSSEIGAAAPGDESVLAYHLDGAVVQRGFDKGVLVSQPKLLSTPTSSTVNIGFEVAAEALSPSSRAWLGRELTAYTASGERCTGRIARFEVRVQAVPHFGMLQTWNGEHDAPRASPAQIAASVASLAQNSEHFVVGVLDRPCAGAWASAVAHPFAPARPAAGGLRERALAAFRKLPRYLELQRKFVKETSDTSHAWEAVDGAMDVVEVRGAERSLLLVSARGSTACDGFGGALSALWELEGTAEAPALGGSVTTFAEYVTLRGGIDETGPSGMALLVGPDNLENEIGVLRTRDARATRRVLLSTSFWDCGC